MTHKTIADMRRELAAIELRLRAAELERVAARIANARQIEAAIQPVVHPWPFA